MYKCEDCNHTFEDGEQLTRTEPHGEQITGCPLCGGNFKEAKQCKICETYDIEDDEEICKSCKNDLKKNIIKIFLNYNEDVHEIIFDIMGEIIK